MHAIRDEIRAFRSAVGMTQGEFAARAGLAKSTISNIESVRMPTHLTGETLRRIRRVMSAGKPAEAPVDAVPLAETLDGSLRALREALGLSQEALARRAGCSVTTINHVESLYVRRKRPTMRTLQTIAEALGAELVVYYRRKA